MVNRFITARATVEIDFENFYDNEDYKVFEKDCVINYALSIS